MKGISKKHWEVLIYLALTLLVFRHWLGASYIVGLDFLSLPSADTVASYLHTWDFNGKTLGFTHTGGFSPELSLTYFFYGVISLSWLGLSMLTITKLVILAGFFFMAFNMRLLVLNLTGNRVAAFVSGLVFMLNPVVAWRYPNQLYIMIGYAFLPLVLLILKRYLDAERTSLKLAVLTAVCLLPMFWTTHITALLALIIGLFIVYHSILNRRRPHLLRRVAGRLCLLVVVVFGLNAVWIIPSVAGILRENPHSYFISEYEPIYYSAQSSFLNVLRLYSSTIFQQYPLSPSNSAASGIWTVLSWVVPLAALSAILLKKHRATSAFFLLLIVIFVPLAMGTKGIESIWLFLFFHFPFGLFTLFKDPSKFALAISLAYAVLVGVTLSAMLAIIQSIYTKYRLWLALALGVLLAAASPLIVNYKLFLQPESVMQMNLDRPPAAFSEADDAVSSEMSGTDGNYYRVMWLPLDRHGATYSWAEWPVRDLFLKVSSRAPSFIYDPYAQPYALDFMQYAYGQMLGGESTSASKIIGFAGVKYVVVRTDIDTLTPITSVNPEDEQARIADYAESDDGLAEIGIFDSEYGRYTVFENKNSVPAVYAAEQAILVVGGINALNSIAESNLSFDQFVLFFANQLSTSDVADLLNNPGLRYVLFDQHCSMSDLAMALVDESHVVYPFDFVSPQIDDPASAWMKVDNPEVLTDLLGFYKQTFTPKHGAIAATGDAELDISVQVDAASNYEFWLKMNHHPDAGYIRIYCDGDPVGAVQALQSTGDSSRYVKLGARQLDQGTHTITLKNGNGLNIVESITIVPEPEVAGLRSAVEQSLSQGKQVINLPANGELPADVVGQGDIPSTFLFRGQTLVQVEAESQGEPFFLFNSQAFSSPWQASADCIDIAPTLGNCFGNAYYVEPQDGETTKITISYRLEAYRPIGLSITCITVALLIGIPIIGLVIARVRSRRRDSRSDKESG